MSSDEHHGRVCARVVALEPWTLQKAQRLCSELHARGVVDRDNPRVLVLSNQTGAEIVKSAARVVDVDLTHAFLSPETNRWYNDTFQSLTFVPRSQGEWAEEELGDLATGLGVPVMVSPDRRNVAVALGAHSVMAVWGIVDPLGIPVPQIGVSSRIEVGEGEIVQYFPVS